MSELTTTYDGAERRPTIVSFSREKDEEVSLEGSEEGPGIEEYLDHAGERFECCGICFPIPFERAHKRSWWDPKFDSEILEGQYRQSAFPQIRLRFR
jgi:adenylate cyclase 9